MDCCFHWLDWAGHTKKVVVLVLPLTVWRQASWQEWQKRKMYLDKEMDHHYCSRKRMGISETHVAHDHTLCVAMYRKNRRETMLRRRKEAGREWRACMKIVWKRVVKISGVSSLNQNTAEGENLYKFPLMTFNWNSIVSP